MPPIETLPQTSDSADKAFRYAWVSLFFWGFLGYPFSSFVSHFAGIETNEISIASRVLLVLIASITLGLAIANGRLYIGRGWLAAYVLFWLMYSTRLIHDCVAYPTQLSRPVTDYLFFGLLVCCFGSIAFLSTPDEAILKKSRLWFFGGLFLISLLSLYNNISEGGFSFGDLDGRYLRFNANDRLNTITYGFLGASLMIQAFNLLVRKSLTFYGSKPFLVGSMLLGALTTLMAGSRSPAVGAVVGVIAVASRLVRKERALNIAAFSVLGLVLAALVLSYSPTAFESITNRFIGIQERDDSSQERIIAYEGAWKQFLSSPFLGDFIEERVTSQYPHNSFLESLMSIGILGGVLYIFIFFLTLVRAAALWRREDTSWIVLLYVQTVITGLVSGSIGFDSNYWYTVVIINVAYSQFGHQEDPKPEEPAPHDFPASAQPNAPI